MGDVMQYSGVKCWACKKVNPYPQDNDFFLCSKECREIYEVKAMARKLNRAERRAAMNTNPRR
jgi:predicted nucleic acid-binding Zn ribbon protein